MDLFPAAFEHVLGIEGGFSDDPHDPGGATNLGITRETLSRWRRRPVSVQEVASLTATEARDIYRAFYWTPSKCEALPWHAALLVFDAAVNHGVAGAAQLLQRVVGTRVDGVIGLRTIGATLQVPPRDFVRNFQAERMMLYASLPTWSRFGRGWSRRAFETALEAMSNT